MEDFVQRWPITPLQKGILSELGSTLVVLQRQTDGMLMTVFSCRLRARCAHRSFVRWCVRRQIFTKTFHHRGMQCVSLPLIYTHSDLMKLSSHFLHWILLPGLCPELASPLHRTRSWRRRCRRLEHALASLHGRNQSTRSPGFIACSRATIHRFRCRIRLLDGFHYPFYAGCSLVADTAGHSNRAWHHPSTRLPLPATVSQVVGATRKALGGTNKSGETQNENAR